MYIFIPMSVEYAEEIAYNWKYEEQYSFYNMDEDEDDLKDFLNQETWEDSVYAVLNEQRQLVGFFQYNIRNSELVIGLGLKPELTGMGLGEKFVQSGLTYGISNFRDKAECVILSVASFNKRAIKLYEKLGFETVKNELVHTNKKDYEFCIMKKSIPLPSDESSINDEKFIKCWEKKRKNGKVIYFLTESIFDFVKKLIYLSITFLLIMIYQMLFKDMKFTVLLNIFKDVFNRQTIVFTLVVFTVIEAIISTINTWITNEKRYKKFINENVGK